MNEDHVYQLRELANIYRELTTKTVSNDALPSYHESIKAIEAAIARTANLINIPNS